MTKPARSAVPAASAPIGVDASGAPLEHVVTTARRLAAEVPWWAALLLGAGIGWLVYELTEKK